MNLHELQGSYPYAAFPLVDTDKVEEWHLRAGDRRGAIIDVWHEGPIGGKQLLLALWRDQTTGEQYVIRAYDLNADYFRRNREKVPLPWYIWYQHAINERHESFETI